ncbi:MAG TPA: hypothetical protein VFD36_00755 [Kofleriaceae bacterium]|jgi:hypothetical protein|nr:hypothetical protein [Kofleriaceae bacterium]
MGFQFAETMAGTVEWDAHPGVQHPFSFEVTAEAASTRTYLQNGKAILRGVVHAPPLVDVADADGTITIRPIGERIIRYELQFEGDDGKLYELIGQKDIRWRAPLRSFTYLPAEILDDEHRRIATCKVAFDLRNDWWSFLRSFRPL